MLLILTNETNYLARKIIFIIAVSRHNFHYFKSFSSSLLVDKINYDKINCGIHNFGNIA